MRLDAWYKGEVCAVLGCQQKHPNLRGNCVLEDIQKMNARVLDLLFF
jgi:hypothetical protein